MDGLGKKIVVGVLVVIITLSGIGVFLALNSHRVPEETATPELIYSGMNVKNPMATVDKDGDSQLDSVENLNVESSPIEALTLLDENGDGIPDALEIVDSSYSSFPSDNSHSQGFAVSDGNYIPGEKERSYLKPKELEDRGSLYRVFPGYAMDIERGMEKKGLFSLRERIKVGIYGLPLPDLEWIEKQGRKTMVPGFMRFGPHGFNWTEFNVTKFRHVVKYDNNSDGNYEYYKEVAYLNLTQDENKNGVYEVKIIRYHLHLYFDNNSDGYPEYEKWLDAMYYSEDANENNVSEVRAVAALERIMKDENSDGNPEIVRAKAVGNETWDEDENGVYEKHLVMLGNTIRYDNNSNGNYEYVCGYFATKLTVDRNEDGKPEILAVSVTGYKKVDNNDDGNPEYARFIHWRYLKKDSNEDGKFDSLNGMAASAVYFDNSSNGYPEYVDAKITGVSYEDTNGDGVNESVCKGMAEWKIENPNDDAYNDTVEFKLYLSNESEPNEGYYQNARKLFVHYIYRDENSDGNPEYKNFKMAGWMYFNATGPNATGATHKAVLWINSTMKDENSDGNPEMKKSRVFYRELWDKNRDGIYEKERGLSEIAYAYDNNSNGVFERKAIKMGGYLAYRNSTTGNITEIHLVVLRGNETNIDDEGLAEFQNHTFLVIHRIDKNGNGNPEYLEVWGVKQQQFLNDTGLINITIMGKYWYRDANDNGLRDHYVFKGAKIVKVDYNLDGEWDKITTSIIYHSGSDE